MSSSRAKKTGKGGGRRGGGGGGAKTASQNAEALVKESIVRNILGKTERRTRQKRAVPVVTLGQLRYKTFGPAELTTKERASLLRQILASEGVCLCNRKPFVNFETRYLRALVTGTHADRSQHAIAAWQNVKFNGEVSDKVLVGFALFRTEGDEVLLMQAICSCRAFNVTHSLFERAKKLGKSLGATRLQLDSLPHVCYYYFAKKNFRFVDPALAPYMVKFGKFLHALSTDDKLRVLGYLSNLSIDNEDQNTRENKKHCLEGFIYMTNKKDRLYHGKVVYRDFLREAYDAAETRKAGGATLQEKATKKKKRLVPMLDVIHQLSRDGIPMTFLLQKPQTKKPTTRRRRSSRGQ